MNDQIIIVDTHDTPIGLRHYEAIHYGDIYRVTALWLTDKKTGSVLLQQRKWDKSNDPGKWQCAVSGTVEAGETYEENIVHEIEEEIGLLALDLHKGPKEYVDSGKHTFFCQWFLASVDKETTSITIQESELESTQWIDRDKLIADVISSPGKYVPSMMEAMETLGVIGGHLQ